MTATWPGPVARTAGEAPVFSVDHGEGFPVLALHGAGVDHREVMACLEPSCSAFVDGAAGDQPLVVVGHSAGGCYAQAIARRRPQQVVGLALLPRLRRRADARDPGAVREVRRACRVRGGPGRDGADR